MSDYDLCLAWNWQYDADFVAILTRACQAAGLSLFQVTPDNLEPTLESLTTREICFRAFFDRASDADDRFTHLVNWARQLFAIRINRFWLARRAWDKASMYDHVLSAGLESPPTLVIPSFEDQPDVDPPDLGRLGDRFVIKPAHGGGGKGVVLDASTWDQVLAARQEYPSDKYLLQAQISPAVLDGRPAWFRLIYCAGKIFSCWWHPHTHVYTPSTESEQERFGLQPLESIARIMARLSQLELFSTEVALTSAGCFNVIDYINDPVDLRLQSKAAEGVPDSVVEDIACQIASFVTARCEPCYAFPSRVYVER